VQIATCGQYSSHLREYMEFGGMEENPDAELHIPYPSTCRFKPTKRAHLRLGYKNRVELYPHTFTRSPPKSTACGKENSIHLGADLIITYSE